MTRAALLALACALLASTAGGARAATPLHQRQMGRVVIPKIGLSAMFYNGQSDAATAHGPSHYPWTGMPGEQRTVAIAGHRVTHTHPFRHLDALTGGDLVRIDYGKAPSFPHHACYRVVRSMVVNPSDVSVTDDTGVDHLVLTTCTPPGSATYRLAVFARRVASCG